MVRWAPARAARRVVVGRGVMAVQSDAPRAAPASQQPLGALVTAIESAVDGVARHWLAIAILGTGMFVGLAFAAPILAMHGHGRAADVIYFAYRITCHQLPQRSWFLGGRAAAYDWSTIHTYLGLDETALLQAYHHPVRDPVLGYQTAFCQRDVAIFGTFFLALIAFGVARHRVALRPIPFKVYLLALVPIGIDGATQLVGLRESTPLLRTVTGAIFGLATALLVMPQLNEGFQEMLDLNSGGRSADGRADATGPNTPSGSG